MAKETLTSKLQKTIDSKKRKDADKASHTWFSRKARELVAGDKEGARETIISDAERRNQLLKRSPGVGFMYTFVYDAKTKDKLPYWDAFPLIFLVDRAEGGFYGLNLHYLPPKHRAALLDALLDIVNNDKYDTRTKLKLSYSVLNGSSKFPLFRPCFKRYLVSHIKSGIAKIPATEWESAIYLPTADFRKASQAKVWADSLRKIK
jgi:hypothetical protein